MTNVTEKKLKKEKTKKLGVLEMLPEKLQIDIHKQNNSSIVKATYTHEFCSLIIRKIG